MGSLIARAAKRLLTGFLAVLMTSAFAGCSGELEKGKPTVVIYSGAEEYRNDYFQKRLDEKFPEYTVRILYMSTGSLAAKLISEAGDSACDIAYDIEAGYVDKLQGVLADLSAYDTSMFMDELVDPGKKVLPEYRNSGCIAINPEVLASENLPEPTSYEDLLKPEYKGLISMPNPKSSGTGYMFLKNLVNATGEEEAYANIDQLADNISQLTSSGSGPVNALIQKEAGIGLAMTAQAVREINNGDHLKILFFEEGSPYTAYYYGMVKGKENREAVKRVFDFFYTDLVAEDKEHFAPEKIYKDRDFTIENYPADIPYGDMSNDSGAEKSRLLEKWDH